MNILGEYLLPHVCSAIVVYAYKSVEHAAEGGDFCSMYALWDESTDVLQCVEHAISFNNAAAIEWIWNCGQREQDTIVYSPLLLRIAIDRNAIDAFKCLFTHNAHFNNDILIAAIQCGNIGIIEWLHEQGVTANNSDYQKYNRGNKNIAKFYYSRIYVLENELNGISIYDIEKDERLFQWFVDNAGTTNLMHSAISYRNLEVAMWLFNNGVPIFDKEIILAINRCHIEILDMLYDERYDIAAAMWNDVNAHSHRIPYCIFSIISANRIDGLNWLYNHCCLGRSLAWPIFQTAVKTEKINVIIWVYHRFKAECDIELKKIETLLNGVHSPVVSNYVKKLIKMNAPSINHVD